MTQPSYTIRGVATDDFGIGTDPSVGIFIDGIYSGRSGASLIFFSIGSMMPTISAWL